MEAHPVLEAFPPSPLLLLRDACQQRPPHPSAVTLLVRLLQAVGEWQAGTRPFQILTTDSTSSRLLLRLAMPPTTTAIVLPP